MGGDIIDRFEDWLHGETLRGWVRQAARDVDERSALTADERTGLKALERESRELRQANEILRKAAAYFAQAEFDRRSKPWSPSSTRTKKRTGSSRSARFCRSPRLRSAPMPCGGATRANTPRAPGATPRCATGFGAFTRRSSRFTARARSGGYCSARARTSRAAPSSHL